MEWQQEECWDEEYPSSVEPSLNLREIISEGVTAMEHQEGITTERATESAATSQPLATARTLSSDENELEDNVDPDEDSQCGRINYGNDEPQTVCELSDEDSFAGV